MEKHKYCRRKAVISGSRIELHEYEFPIIYGFTGRGGEGEKQEYPEAASGPKSTGNE